MRGFDLRVLMEHMAWADATLWQAALAAPGAAGDERLRTLLHHIAECQWVYLGLMRGEGVTTRALSELPTLEAVRDWSRAYHFAAARFLAAQPDPGRPLEVPWSDQLAARFGRVVTASLGEALVQVASHSTYHRGQANTRIRELGGEPPLVDFIIWVWAGRPAAEWPAPAAQTQEA